MDFNYLTIKKTHEAIVNKKISVSELIKETFNRINKIDGKIRAFITLSEDSALKKASEIDRLIESGAEVPLLAGIPYSAKDVFSTTNLKTTASSHILENYIPVYNATAIEKLNAQKAILIGKTNNDAFGFGSSTENSDFQITRNPWNTDKVPGGSSGGSAAAVACGLGLFSLAEDTGGSIRQPACFCGVTGIKATYGRVSRYGVLSYGSSLDTVGVIANSVEDAAITLGKLAGRDVQDATTLPVDVPDYYNQLENIPAKIKIGVPEEYFIPGMNQEVESGVKKAIMKFEEMGAEVIPVKLTNTKYAISAYYLSGISEVSANLARYDGIRFGYSDPKAATIEETYKNSRATGFGDEVKRRIMLGTYALSAGYYDAYYKKAQQIRTLIKKDFEEAFKKVDLLVTPVSPIPPFNIGEKSDDPIQMWLADVFTVTINPAGIPALALPCGFTSDNLPIGMQLVGPQLSENLLFSMGHAYQKITNWHSLRPVLK